MAHSRRSFIGGLAGIGAGFAWSPLAAQTTSQLKPLLTGANGSENYWTVVAGQFPLTSGKIPMNAANLCPAPRLVSDRVADLNRDEDSDISNPNRAKFNALAAESRSKVAEHLGVSADEIALVRNTSEANNTINNGVPLKAGDEVVLWEQNHQCNNAAWDVRAERHGFTVKRVTLPATINDPQDIVNAFEAALSPKTKALSITYISNTSGIRLPAKELSPSRGSAASTFTSTVPRHGAISNSTSKILAAILIRRARTSGSWARNRLECCMSARRGSRRSGRASCPSAGTRIR